MYVEVICSFLNSTSVNQDLKKTIDKKSINHTCSTSPANQSTEKLTGYEMLSALTQSAPPGVSLHHGTEPEPCTTVDLSSVLGTKGL